MTTQEFFVYGLILIVAYLLFKSMNEKKKAKKDYTKIIWKR